MLKSPSNIFDKLIFYLFVVLVFFSPLIFTTSTFELFEFPKTFFLYLLGSTIISLYLIKKIREWKIPIINLKSTTNILILVLLFINIASTLLSSHPYTSIWGYYTRFNGGLISTIIYVFLYFISTEILTKKDFERLLNVSLLSLMPVCVYAVLQHFSQITNIYKTDPSIRVFSTFGQPNWLAVFIGMLLPTIILKFDKAMPYLWFLIYTLAFSALWFTYSISGLLGFFVGVIYLLLLRKNELKNNFKIYFALAFISITIAILNPGIFRGKMLDVVTDIKKIITLNKPVFAASEPVYKISDTGSIRSGLWGGTLNLISNNYKTFFIGTGPQTFPYEFQKFRPQAMNYSSEWDFVFNKPHKYYLELWSDMGVFTLIVYLAVLMYLIKSKNSTYAPGLLALYVSNIFGWPTVATNILFFIFIAGMQKKE